MRTIIGSAGYLLVAANLGVWLFWPFTPPMAIRFEGQKPMDRAGGRSVTYAQFELHNISSRTVYYEGTPYPVYFIERLENGRWLRNEVEVDAENFAALFPGRRFRFKLVAPTTGTNEWRLAVRWIRPQYAPVTFRRFFPARCAVLFSDPIKPVSSSPHSDYAAAAPPIQIPAAVP
jgi:hypothetical protein